MFGDVCVPRLSVLDVLLDLDWVGCVRGAVGRGVRLGVVDWEAERAPLCPIAALRGGRGRGVVVVDATSSTRGCEGALWRRE